MPKEAFDVCNCIKVPSDSWQQWKAKNLKTVKKAGKECVVFNSDAALNHFKTAKNGKPTRVDEQACIVRYCSKDRMDLEGACIAGDSLPAGGLIKFSYAGQYIGCYIGSAEIVNFGKYAGATTWSEKDGVKPGVAGEPDDAKIDFACSVWGLDTKKVKGNL